MNRRRRAELAAFLCVGLGLTSACGSLFFQPARRKFIDPVEYGVPAPEEVKLVSRDGTALWGWVFPPRAGKLKGWIVQFHGNAQNISAHFASCVWLIDHGYGLMAFDYRGYGPSEGAAKQPGVHEDGVAILEYALSRDQAPLIAVGQSLGGALLPRALAEVFSKQPAARSRFKTLVIDSSFISYRAEARSVLSHHWLTWIFQPLAYLLVDEKYSPKDAYGALAGLPVLVVHGDEDRVVSFEFGEEVFEAAHPPKRFWRMPGVGHIESWWVASFRAKFLNYLDGFR